MNQRPLQHASVRAMREFFRVSSKSEDPREFLAIGVRAASCWHEFMFTRTTDTHCP